MHYKCIATDGGLGSIGLISADTLPSLPSRHIPGLLYLETRSSVCVIQSQQSGQLVMAEKQVQQLTQAILVKQQQFQAHIAREARQLRQPLDIEVDKASMSLSQAQQLMDSYEDIQNKKNREQQLKVCHDAEAKLFGNSAGKHLNTYSIRNNCSVYHIPVFLDFHFPESGSSECQP